MIAIIITLGILWVLTTVVSFKILKRLNQYIAKLEIDIEKNLIVTENLKQSLRDILVDASFLLDDGKLKPIPIKKEKGATINGVELNDESVSF